MKNVILDVLQITNAKSMLLVAAILLPFSWSPPVNAGLLDSLKKAAEKALVEEIEKAARNPSDKRQTEPNQQDPLVFEAQISLYSLGYNVGTPDGRLNNQTIIAIRTFQFDSGLPPDGKVTNGLLLSLRAASDHYAKTGQRPGDVNAGSKQAGKPVATPAKSAPAPAETPAPQPPEQTGVVSGHQVYQPGPTKTDIPSNAATAPTTAGLQPDYRTLFKMYMAGQGDVIDVPAMAYEYHLLFNFPPEKKAREQCTALRNEWSDEFTRAELTTRLQAPFSQALDTARSWPKTAVFTVRPGKLRLGEYDQERGVFPVASVAPLDRTNVPRPKTACYVPSRIPPAGIALLPSVGVYSRHVRGGFQLMYSGAENVRSLSMSKSAAQAYLKAHTRGSMSVNRNVILELTVETEPVPIRDGRMQAIPARILAARLLDPLNEKELQSYPSSVFASPKSKTPGNSRDDAVQLTRYMITLLALRDHPRFLDNKWVVDMVSRHIAVEQRRWEKYDARVAQCRSCNPDRPAFVFEWQKLEKQNPKLANGVLMDVFVRPELAWDFVKNEPEWDDRFGALIEVFIFERGKVEGRDPKFAARELLPVWKRHMAAALKRLPRHILMTSELTTPEYDFDTMSFPLKPTELLKPMPNPLFRVPPGKKAPSRLTVVLPESARSASLYEINYLPQPIVARKPGGNINSWGVGPADDWRNALEHFYCRTCATEDAGILGNALALDRRLELSSIPIPPAKAERLIAKLAKGSSSYRGAYKVKATITFEAVSVNLGQLIGGQSGNVPSSAILNGRVEQVELHTLNQNLITSFGPDDFPDLEAINAEKQVEQQKAKEAKAKADAIAQNLRGEIEARFAYCDAMTDLTQQSKCLSDLYKDRVALHFTNDDNYRLRNKQKAVSNQLMVLETSKRTMLLQEEAILRQEQMEKCMALTDRDEMNRCFEAIEDPN